MQGRYQSRQLHDCMQQDVNCFTSLQQLLTFFTKIRFQSRDHEPRPFQVSEGPKPYPRKLLSIFTKNYKFLKLSSIARNTIIVSYAYCLNANAFKHIPDHINIINGH